MLRVPDKRPCRLLSIRHKWNRRLSVGNTFCRSRCYSIREGRPVFVQYFLYPLHICMITIYYNTLIVLFTLVLKYIYRSTWCPIRPLWGSGQQKSPTWNFWAVNTKGLYTCSFLPVYPTRVLRYRYRSPLWRTCGVRGHRPRDTFRETKARRPYASPRRPVWL